MDTTAPAPRLVVPGPAWPLHDIDATRALERAGLAATDPHVLMRRAGLATARLALALHPHAGTIWIAAGPGNNGGDGMEAALHLHAAGKRVVLTWLGDRHATPDDAAAAHDRVRAAGIPLAQAPPEHWDLCIDALLGIGGSREPHGMMAQWIARIGQRDAPVLSVDIPTGLHADTGVAAATHVRADATLCLLTLKPGLFTADGRDVSRQVWLDELQCDATTLLPVQSPTAMLIGAPPPLARWHASHKGSYGDVAVVGGAPGMAGAASLAASAALHGGAGRVFVCLLGEASAGSDATAGMPELMRRAVDDLDLARTVIVCGCGGGDRVQGVLPALLAGAARLVLDADALNAVADDAALRSQLHERARHAWATVLTPHPLEAARLLGTTVAQVQSDRLNAARQLAREHRCTVVLKGSGTIVAAPDATMGINPTGNARLAVPGSGDVLAGLIGSAMAAGLSTFDAACHAVYRHAAAADHWPPGETLTASALARRAGGAAWDRNRC
ncbi:NAD(P)H-hydrate dehydratase [Comamonadaceae bacterium G21597-S1]|nr:NAD(P)H-hydrate dehydratase [Comamonadaceae bacterium G21597-S1]